MSASVSVPWPRSGEAHTTGARKQSSGRAEGRMEGAGRSGERRALTDPSYARSPGSASRSGQGVGLPMGMSRFHDRVDAAAHLEVPHDRHAPRREQRHEIAEDAIGDRLVEVSFVAEGPEVELQALQLDAQLVGR